MLACVAYDLILASCHLVISVVNWPGCLCLESASCAPGLLLVDGRSVSLAVADLLGDLHTVGSSESMHAKKSVGFRVSPGRPLHCGGLLPCVQQISWEAFRLWGLQRDRHADDLPCCPECSRSPGRYLDCGVCCPKWSISHGRPSNYGIFT